MHVHTRCAQLKQTITKVHQEWYSMSPQVNEGKSPKFSKYMSSYKQADVCRFLFNIV